MSKYKLKTAQLNTRLIREIESGNPPPTDLEFTTDFIVGYDVETQQPTCCDKRSSVYYRTRK
jgi:hypothetical protein